MGCILQLAPSCDKGADVPHTVSVSHRLWAAREQLRDEVVDRGRGHGRYYWPRRTFRRRGSCELEAVLTTPGGA